MTLPANAVLSTAPELRCYREYADPPSIIPGRPERAWMDTTVQRFAYRCTPLSIANCSGWEIVLPESFTAFWKGGSAPGDVVTSPLPDRLKPIVESVFGHGILTFHPGYLFRTSPGWGLSVRGPPNTVKHGIAALEGLVETEWLPFTFTMNWRFTQPGRVHFNKGECFCFISPVPHAILDQIAPRICDFSDDPNLKAAYDGWREGRAEFQARIARGDDEARKQAWQRDYLHGRDPSGNCQPEFHLSKRKLKQPQ